MPVGTTLMNLRRERGKTLAEIESSTKIMGRMLSSLENGRWDELPATVYVKGYIQNYASALGIDAKPLLEEYAKDISVPSQTDSVPLRRLPSTTVVPHRLDVHQIPRGAWIAVAAAVIAVALLVWGVTALFKRGDTPPPIAPEATATPGATGSAPEDSEQASTEALADGSFRLSVAVAEGQSSWLQISVDSMIAYEGDLPGGESKQWDVSDEAVIKVGKPTAVTIRRDGQAVAIEPSEGIAEVTLVAQTGQ